MTETNWTEEYLKSLIHDGVTESLILDYKGSGALTPKTDSIKKEISKDVSSFANSAGGTIIYGIREVEHLPTELDGIDLRVVTREWLDQVISSRIQRRIDNVRIYQVPLSGGTVAYVVSIPQSNRAPHMASDNRFYKRFEYQSVAMEEYEVRDVANRAIGPILKIKIQMSPSKLTFEEGENLSHPVSLMANVENENTTPATCAVFNFLIDKRIHCHGSPQGFVNQREAILQLADGSSRSHLLWHSNWSTPGKMPIWRGINFGLFDSHFQIQVPNGSAEYGLGWIARAPYMSDSSELLILSVSEDNSVSLRATGVGIQL